MAFYEKIGLLVLNDDATEILVCQKSPDNVTAQYIMPGGQFEESSHQECLQREIQEELSCDIDLDSLELIGDYEDIAAGHTDRTVHMVLYQGRLIGTPVPSSEIKQIHWIGAKDIDNPLISAIIRNKIIPDLISRNVLR